MDNNYPKLPPLLALAAALSLTLSALAKTPRIGENPGQGAKNRA